MVLKISDDRTHDFVLRRRSCIAKAILVLDLIIPNSCSLTSATKFFDSVIRETKHSSIGLSISQQTQVSERRGRCIRVRAERARHSLLHDQLTLGVFETIWIRVTRFGSLKRRRVFNTDLLDKYTSAWQR